MKIASQNEAQLVLRESTVWSAVVLGIVTLLFIVLALAPGQHVQIWRAVLFGAMFVRFYRSTTVVFDRARGTVEWKKMQLGKTTLYSLPLNSITAVLVDAKSKSSWSGCRLLLVTPAGQTPVTDAYGTYRKKCAALREAVLGFVPASARMAPAMAAAQMVG
jgi:hypothetical protein